MPETKKNILIIDDDVNLLEVLSIELKDFGYEVDTAVNGEEGFEQTKKNRPDLIVLDIIMPGMDGFEFYKLVKKDPEIANIPVLVLTGRAGMQDVFQALDVEAFMVKPFDTEVLLYNINFLLSSNALILSNDTYVAENISQAISKYNLETNIVSSESSMREEGKSYKYDFIVAYLSAVTSEPKRFLEIVRNFKSSNIPIVIYCDKDIIEIAGDNVEPLNELRNEWETEGVSLFYDERLIGETFSTAIKDIIPKKE